jgi:hypothetical protein
MVDCAVDAAEGMMSMRYTTIQHGRIISAARGSNDTRGVKGLQAGAVTSKEKLSPNQTD